MHNIIDIASRYKPKYLKIVSKINSIDFKTLQEKYKKSFLRDKIKKKILNYFYI